MAPEPKRVSYQFRALSRKTLSYQKRQNVVNCCCVVACPFMMVMIAGILVLVIDNLIASMANPNPIVASVRYCSNSGPATSQDFPIVFSDLQTTLRNSSFKGKTVDVKYLGLDLGDDKPCAYAIDETYQQSGPYFVNSEFGSRDQSYVPNPVGGWFDPQYTIPLLDALLAGMFPPANANGTIVKPADPELKPLYSNLMAIQKYPWNYVFSNLDIGSKDQAASVNLATDIPVPGAETGKSGFLGRTPTKYFKFNQSLYLPADFYVKGSGNADEYMFKALKDAVELLEDAFLPTDVNGNSTFKLPTDPLQLRLETIEGLRDKHMAFGALYIDELDVTKLRAKTTFQTGRILRLESVLQFARMYERAAIQPPLGLRLLHSLSQMTNGLLASSSNALFQVAHTLRAFPESKFYDMESLPFDFGVLIGTYTYPFSLTFLLPIFVLTLVKEKEDKILIMMRMHGLSTFQYYLSHYMHFITLQLMSSLVFVLTGLAFRLKLFV